MALTIHLPVILFEAQAPIWAPMVTPMIRAKVIRYLPFRSPLVMWKIVAEKVIMAKTKRLVAVAMWTGKSRR